MSLYCNTHCLDKLIYDLLIIDREPDEIIHISEVEEEIERFLRWLVEQYAQQKDEENG